MRLRVLPEKVLSGASAVLCGATRRGASERYLGSIAGSGTAKSHSVSRLDVTALLKPRFAAPSRSCVSAHSGNCRLSRCRLRRLEMEREDQWSAHWLAPAEPPEVAASLRRVAHSIRPEGAAPAGPRARARAATTAGRIRECRFDWLLRSRSARAHWLWSPRGARRRWPPASIWRGGRRCPLVPPRRAATWGLAQVLLFVAAQRAHPIARAQWGPRGVRPASAGGTSGSLLPPTPPFRRRLRWFEE